MIDSFRFGKRLQAARKMQQLTVKELAAQSSLSNNFISQLEQGNRHPSLEKFVLLSNLLKVSPDYLLCDSLNADTALLAAELLEKIQSLPKHSDTAVALNHLGDLINKYGGKS